MIQWSISLRALAFLRRLVRAAESIADSQRTLARVSADEWNRAHPTTKRKAPVEISAMDLTKIEDEWRKEQEILRENEQ